MAGFHHLGPGNHHEGVQLRLWLPENRSELSPVPIVIYCRGIPENPPLDLYEFFFQHTHTYKHWTTHEGKLLYLDFEILRSNTEKKFALNDIMFQLILLPAKIFVC